MNTHETMPHIGLQPTPLPAVSLGLVGSMISR